MEKQTLLEKEKKSVKKAQKAIKKAEDASKKTEKEVKKAVADKVEKDDDDDTVANKKLTPQQKRQKQVEKLENQLAVNKTKSLVTAQAEKKKDIEKTVKAVKKAIKKKKDAEKPTPEAIKKIENKVKNSLPDGEEAMGDEKCFYIKHNSENQVFHVEKEDAYAPQVTGVYNVDLEEFKAGDKGQMFSYNAKTKSISSYLFPDKSIFEGQNRLLIAYKSKGLKNQKFEYDIKDMNWVNAFSGRGFELDKEGNKIKVLKSRHKEPGHAQVITSKMNHGSGDQKWKIIRCSESESDYDKRRSLFQQGTGQTSD